MEDKLPQMPDVNLLDDITDGRESPVNVPAKKLLALMEASDEMMKSIFRRDRKETLNTVTRCVHDLLEAEACSIFLVPENSPEEIVLEAAFTDKWKYDFDRVHRRIQSTPKGGFIGHVAREGKIVRLNSVQLENNEYIADKNATYLSAGQCLSTLGIPLKDRKNHVLGVLKVDNKKDANGNPNKATSFDEVDESITRILANKIVIVLESLRTVNAVRELMQDVLNAQDIKEILNTILKRGIEILHADRGDFVLWDESKRSLIVAAQHPDSTLVGEPLPDPSVVHALWKSDTPYSLINDVSSDSNFYRVHPKTQSEIAVRLDLEGRPIGVLNAESFQLIAFDSRDLESLQILAQYAAIAIRLVGRETHLRGIVQRLVEHSPSQNEILTSILESVRDIYGFDAGIIYIADNTNRALRCSDFIGCDGLNINPREFSYQFDDVALATKVLREKNGYFSQDPPNDSNVSQKGVEAFQIGHNPLVAVPLIFREKAVGVLVVWSRQSQPPTPEPIDRLEPFARLAAANVAISNSEQQRTVILQTIQGILTQMQIGLSLKDNLRLILQGVQTVGFDRVRLYKYEEDQCFVGLDSLGMDGPMGFRGYTIFRDRNPYVEHMVETSRSNLQARKYDPTSSEFEGFGIDPNAESLGMPPELPWASVPLVIAGKFYGCISADNKQTQREIMTDGLESLTLLGALAAQAIANAETIEMEREQMKVQAHNDLARRTIHDLRTPAMTTQIFLKRLIKGLQDLPSVPAEVFSWAEKVGRQVDRISALAEGMQRLRQPLELRNVNINELVQRAIHDSLTTDDCKVVFDLSKPDPILAVDVDDIDQAITQLAANAWQAMENNGKLVVKTSISSPAQHPRLRGESDEKFVLISLMDSGPGVPHSIRPNIFNVGVSTTGGAGLGLYSVRIIAEEHGGAAWLENTVPNGSTFIIALPSEVMEGY